jgi:hypothetical protein
MSWTDLVIPAATALLGLATGFALRGKPPADRQAWKDVDAKIDAERNAKIDAERNAKIDAERNAKK